MRNVEAALGQALSVGESGDEIDLAQIDAWLKHLTERQDTGGTHETLASTLLRSGVRDVRRILHSAFYHPVGRDGWIERIRLARGEMTFMRRCLERMIDDQLQQREPQFRSL